MPLTFIHISDTHLGTEKTFRLQGVPVFERASAIVKKIKSLPFRPAFAVHSGDISNRSADASDGAYALARECFSVLDVPLYFIAGNHDDTSAMRSLLPFPAVEWLQTPGGRLDYRFEAGGMTVLVLDARASESAEGELLDAQFERIQELINAGKKFMVLTHFLPFDIGVPWYLKFQSYNGPDRMLIKNGERLHAILATAPSLCAGVFFGHVHTSHSIHRDGILYSSAPSATLQIAGWPNLDQIVFEPDAPPGFHAVHIGEFGTVVTSYSISCDEELERCGRV